MSMMNFTRTVLKNLFSKPATRPYPAQPCAFTPRTRGSVAMARVEDCIFCGLCSRKCPTGAISVDRAAKSWTIRRFDCIQCNCCVETCPKACLAMAGQYPQPSAVKPSETVVQPPKEEPKEESDHA